MLSRVEKIREARRLRALGWTAPAIGRELGVSESTVRNWYLGGDCIDCGTPITYASRLHTITRCDPCDLARAAATKVWTREAVLDAIRRFAHKHGRPPISSEWIASDPVNGYPPRSQVYRSRDHSSSPFATWNEAIEAAGLTPTPKGHYPRLGDAGLGYRSRHVLDLLRHAGRPLPRGYLVRQTGCSRGVISHVMRGLIRRGLIVRTCRGMYAAAANEERQAA